MPDGDYTYADSDGYCMISGEEVIHWEYKEVYDAAGKPIRTDMTGSNLKCKGDCQACNWWKMYKEDNP